MNKTSERIGNQTGAPLTHIYPQISGGICDWCGVKDNLKPSHEQYKYCDHFKNFGELVCTYCDPATDSIETIKKSQMLVFDHPFDKTKLVVRCDRSECKDKHLKRFQVNI